MVLVLSGPVHGGKTTFLERAVPIWTGRGLSCEGFLSPAVTDESGRPGYDLLEIATGRRQTYLRRRGDAAAERVGPYFFLAPALERARAIIRGAGPSGLLVVDEIGPLELDGGGLWPALREALEVPGRTALLVIREEILTGFAARIAPVSPVVFDIRDPETGRLLEERLFEASPPR